MKYLEATMDKMMIGTFSNVTGISKRMLRHYDKTGLLNPVHIDPINEYRYYSHDQIKRIGIIKQLQDFGFTLGEIKEIIDAEIDKNTFIDMMKDKEARLRTSVDIQVSQLIKLNQSIAYLSEALEDNHAIEISALSLERNSMENTNIESIKNKLRLLPNQSMFNELVEEFMTQTDPVSIYYLTFDIDMFSSVNDQYGFDVGDLVIYQIYQIIDQYFNELLINNQAFISRLGGDEFALFIHGVDEAVVTNLVDKTIKSIHDFDFSIHGCDGTITESCGICKGDQSYDYRNLRHISVKALIDAKRNGRNQWKILQS